ncbi:MAG: DUF308 domain-containing protein [Pseudomonadota bacterium]
MVRRPSPEEFRGQALDMMKGKAGWLIFVGLVMLALGIAAALLPHLATLVVETVIAYLLLLAGIATLIKVFKSSGTGRAVEFLMALLYGAVGVLLLMQPVEGVLALTIIVAVYFFADGVLRLLLAFQAAEGKGWQIIGALSSIALGVIIVAGYPFDATWLLGLLVGINLAISGLGMLAVGIKLRRL